MQSGDLRNRVGFFQRAAAADDFGNAKGGYPAEPAFEMSANVKPKLGGEQVLVSRLQGTSFVNVTVRQCANTRQVTVDWIAKDMRSGEVFNIRSIIDPDEGTSRHGMFFEMLCEKGVAV
jgi:hypothetical protein